MAGAFYRFCDAWKLVHFAAEVEEVRVLPYTLLVGFEVHHVHRVEAHERVVEPDVHVREAVAQDVAPIVLY